MIVKYAESLLDGKKLIIESISDAKNVVNFKITAKDHDVVLFVKNYKNLCIKKLDQKINSIKKRILNE